MTERPGTSADTTALPTLKSPAALRRRADLLDGRRRELKKRSGRIRKQMEDADNWLALAPQVTAALSDLSDQMFAEVLSVVEERLTVALQDILEQPIELRAKAEFKRGTAWVEFTIERQGNAEDILLGQGGSVQNILSVGLRMFALATLDPQQHRHFLVLDEQDCWLRPELVPRLVQMVAEAAGNLGFQVLMISHHDIGLFEKYADRVFRLQPTKDSVEVTIVDPQPAVRDGE